MNELKTKQELMFCSAKVLHILIHFPHDVLLDLWLAGVTNSVAAMLVLFLECIRENPVLERVLV